jgi:hypothetical protein
MLQNFAIPAFEPCPASKAWMEFTFIRFSLFLNVPWVDDKFKLSIKAVGLISLVTGAQKRYRSLELSFAKQLIRHREWASLYFGCHRKMRRFLL